MVGRLYRRRGIRALLTTALLVAACSQPRVAEACRVRFGVAAFDRVDPLASIEPLAAAGFDYVEPALSKLAALPAAELEQARARLQASSLRAEAMNWFLPGDELKVTGPVVDDVRVAAYVERALGIADSFGAKVIVFGSPRARSFPDDFPAERAWQQLVSFLRTCAAIIERRGFRLQIAIEALRRPETNLINTTAQALALAREVDRPQVRVVIDFYHLTFEHEDLAIVFAARDWLVHVQIADPAARGFPRTAAHEPRYEQFFANLRAIDYRGRASIEAIAADLPADAKHSLAFLRKLAGQ